MNKYTPEMIKFVLDAKDSGLTYKQVTKQFNEKFNLNKTSNALRKVYNSYVDVDFDEETLEKAAKAQYRASAMNSRLRKINKAVIQDTVYKEDFIDSLKDVLDNNPPKIHKPVKTKKSKKKTKRTIVAHVSDTHIGCCIRKEEMDNVNEFNPTVAARRFAYYFKQVAEYKPEHRDETDLVMVLNGDLVAGIIHDQEWGVLPMTTQFSLALSIFTQGISYLAQQFNNVRVICTTGNHGRYMHKSNKGRVSNAKWDGFDVNIYIALEYALKSHKNVSFQIPETPYAKFEIQGHKFFATHGDTVVSVGNVSKTINIHRIKDQLNDISSALGEKVDVALIGHIHKATWQTLDNGTELLINGTLSGTDGFAQSIGILHNNPSQQIIEVTEKYSAGDVRFVRVKDADNMKELDKIIEPMTSSF
jgi:hypothetical protein